MTAYVNGQNLGTKTPDRFRHWSRCASLDRLRWHHHDRQSVGWQDVDELAIYGSALSEDTIQIHFSTSFLAPTPPSPRSSAPLQPRPSFWRFPDHWSVQAGGTLPLKYQWTANSMQSQAPPVPTLAVSNITTTTTYERYGPERLRLHHHRTIVLTTAAPPAGYPATVMPITRRHCGV